MQRTLVVASLALAGLVACATPSLPEIPATHPASPQATEAPLAPASDALALEPGDGSEPKYVPAGAPAPSEQHGRHHGH